MIIKLFTVLCSLLLVTCMPGSGRSSVPGDAPQRIVSLVPAVTEILFAIGAGDLVVGVTQYCDYPPEARSRTSVGGFAGATMSMEQIRVLRPDLVFISEDMHGRILSLLDELGIAYFAVEPRNFSEVYDTILQIGEVTGFLSGAELLVTQMQEKIAFAVEQVQGKGRPAVFWLLAENPLMSAGRETFITEAIYLGGGQNIFSEISEQWPLVSPEQILLRRPDWILAGDDMGGIVQFHNNPFWQTIPAAREGRIAIVNADILYRYGPRLADGVILIAEILHGLDLND